MGLCCELHVTVSDSGCLLPVIYDQLNSHWQQQFDVVSCKWYVFIWLKFGQTKVHEIAWSGKGWKLLALKSVFTITSF